MIEVFKTNIETEDQSRMVAWRIAQSFRCYKVNFDLQDVDRILRIESPGEAINSEVVTELLNALGFRAEVLPDVVGVFEFDFLDDCRLRQ